jgi:hypothetical protein
LSDREPGAVYEFRQSLIDAASAAELIAADLPEPDGSGE